MTCPAFCPAAIVSQPRRVARGVNRPFVPAPDRQVFCLIRWPPRLGGWIARRRPRMKPLVYFLSGEPRLGIKLFSDPLENFFGVFILNFLSRIAAPDASSGSGRAPHDVQAPFVSILLLGGLGYENF